MHANYVRRLSLACTSLLATRINFALHHNEQYCHSDAQNQREQMDRTPEVMHQGVSIVRVSMPWMREACRRQSDNGKKAKERTKQKIRHKNWDAHG